MAATARHQARALLRAHLAAAAASTPRHLTRHCPICHRLLRLALDSAPASAPAAVAESGEAVGDESASTG
ncbi:DUF6274 family protein [Streptomyces echinoruber]|uniref:Uncharacterized protein n=1 Tax=Streptomyces echinoruber TaxID=68898 RepID=A0A918RJZ5_9ACTN|nr:DUF6274 family protein [Streptomyces echinoruber]GHA02055.1 hypothetical protein GCM10010389_46740 [Streptomyces echinoruber]